jgi:threonine dehydratase
MSRSIRAGRRVTLRSPGLFADGVCVKTPGREPFRLCRRLLDGMVRVSTTETCAAIRDVFEATRAVCEPAGALSVAAARKSARRGERAVCIVSGANINFDSIRSVIEHAASERQIKSNGGEKGGQ